MFHPLEGGVEFIEIHNVGATTLTLTGVRFTKGIDFDFPDGTTIARAIAAGLDPAAIVASFDSHRLFATLNDAIVTGPTDNNVRDLRVIAQK